MIEVNQLTKVFFNQKGIHDVSFKVEQGQIFGFLGPNGAGKSTTIRHLLGLMKPQKGAAKINGKDCWYEADKIHGSLGYIPGEISFIEGLKAIEFLQLISGMRNHSATSRRDELIERLHLDIKTPINKMSKGMKQKLAIICAFMHDPGILILDEPSSGLDPLMQRTFVELLQEEKEKGKVILISSHIFNEVEDTADIISIIRDGKIVEVEDISVLKSKMLSKCFDVTFENVDDVREILDSQLKVVEHAGDRIKIAVNDDINSILSHISRYKIKNLEVPTISLEEMFMQYYEKEDVG